MFAVACGLHALKPPEWHPVNLPSLLLPTLSRAEIRHRVRLWWIIFTTSRFSGSATNIDTDIDDKKIETVWELPPESDGFKEIHCSTVSSLFIRDSSATYVYEDTANAIRSKCAALVERAARFGLMAALALKDDREFWDKFEIVDRAIRRVTSSLPSLYEEPRYEVGAAHVESQTRQMNQFTIVYHFIMCDAVICLHSRLARTGNIASRDACLEASWGVMPAARQLLEQPDMDRSVFSCLTVVWARMFREFGIEYNRLVATGDFERAQLIVPELKVLSTVLRERAAYRSLANTMIANLKSAFPLLRDEPGIF